MATAPNTNYLTYATAFGLAAFSGSVATYGLTKFCPGAELVVAVMGILFECGKLTAFAMLHKKMPLPLKGALAAVGLVLMVLNVVGVSGFLSNAYERQQIGARATSHTAQTTAAASTNLVERQLAAAESNLAQAHQALVRARDDRGRVKAAQAIVTTAAAERDALVKQLAAAQTSKAKSEGDAISTGGEFAAITFLSDATGASADAVAHVVIMIVASLPDVLAVLLLLAATSVQSTEAKAETIEAKAETEPTPVKAPAKPETKRVRKTKRRPARKPALSPAWRKPVKPSTANDNVLPLPATSVTVGAHYRP
jgi:hypothetical protein